MVILGTQLVGETMEGFFNIANYYMPKRNILPLAASANCDEAGNGMLFLGAPASGRTALSVNTSKHYIGDTHQGWSPDGIFNLYGGVYPKINTISCNKLLSAIRFGAVVENANFFPGTREIDYHDTEISTNARASIPNSYMANVRQPEMCGHPTNIVYLVNDPDGVFPVVSKLTPEQAVYHYLSGYSPSATGDVEFSACFAEPYLAYHPSLYAQLLSNGIKRQNV
jgi:phosphoenolpyruvate carboxykinase (ATP)